MYVLIYKRDSARFENGPIFAFDFFDPKINSRDVQKLYKQKIVRENER